jgi:transcriptional regulator with XRE-family HTH domain
MTDTTNAPKERTELIRARELLGLNGSQLAERLGVVKSTVYRIEAGISHPSLAMMQRWVKALGPGVSMEIFRAASAKPRHAAGHAAKPRPLTTAEWLASDEA